MYREGNDCGYIWEAKGDVEPSAAEPRMWGTLNRRIS